jgi:hypothetical protein
MRSAYVHRFFLAMTAAVFACTANAHAEADTAGSWLDRFEADLHGYGELRSGFRTRNDPHEKDLSVMEARLQLELSVSDPWFDFKYKGDAWADGITEQGEYDTRELWIFSRPVDFLDVKVGRQVLTWGTGDLVFLNDLFPKDWRSFFIGRDAEYLKAPSDAVKLGIFTDIASIDLVYTPRFDPDRFITGEYVSYWNNRLKRRAGRDARVSADKPGHWFRDDEIAVRLYRNISGYEFAAYGYRGYWKTPAGRTPAGVATFPPLNVYGASARGGIGKGIGNIEFAWYQSVDNESGRNPLANNSEMRYLIGYTEEIGRDFSAGLQYYVEQLLDYGEYRQHGNGMPGRDHFRHVITVQLTKLLMNQNLKLSLSGYYSPSDRDTYLRPNIQYKYSDRISLETGANVFIGDCPDTFFSQFRNNTNIYSAVRYSF